MVLEWTALVLGLLGLVVLGSAVVQAWRGRLGRGLLRTGGGSVLVLLGLLLGAIAMNLHTYQRLTAEQAVAEIEFVRISATDFLARLERPDGTRQSFEMDGQEWQLDARVLKWTGPAVILGFETAYRLERLSGRYRDVRDYNGSPAVYDLSEERGVDLWRIARRHQRWMPGVDTIYGSATYMPMADGARYIITISASGLVTRPANEAARRAVERW